MCLAGTDAEEIYIVNDVLGRVLLAPEGHVNGCGEDVDSIGALGFGYTGLTTYYVLFFLHLESRRITLAGITRHPTETWMTQMARRPRPRHVWRASRVPLRAARPGHEVLLGVRRRAGVRGHSCLRLPPRCPNLNAFAERWLRSVKRGMPQQTHPVPRAFASTGAG